LVEGIRLLKLLPNARLLVSGASRDKAIAPVAWGYRDAALALGVAPDQIVVLDTPVDTGGEAKAVKSWVVAQGANSLSSSRLILVTSASHIPRAMRHFESAGLHPLAAPTHYLASRGTGLGYWVPSAENLKKSERAWYELLGLLAVKLEH
jgi:uncharacterized SAM-binding protein YcdF (DUF218 family)